MPEESLLGKIIKWNFIVTLGVEDEEWKLEFRCCSIEMNYSFEFITTIGKIHWLNAQQTSHENLVS